MVLPSGFIIVIDTHEHLGFLVYTGVPRVPLLTITPITWNDIVVLEMRLKKPELHSHPILGGFDMKKGDVVKFTLYDAEQTGTVTKIHQEKGWKGYITVLLKSKNEVLVPVSILKKG